MSEVFFRSIIPIFAPKRFNTLIFFVTSKCNSRCKFCFYWRNLNKKEQDLTLEEVGKVARTLPQFSNLLISGGEPFLRDDLPDLIRILYEKNGVKNVSIPTNGLLGDKIALAVQKILSLCPDVNLNVNFSLDGVGKTHDKLRGVPGNYQKTIRSIRKLNNLEKQNPNLKVKIATVICRDNLEKMGELLREIKKEKISFLHYFELVRGEPRLSKEKSLTLSRLKGVYRRVLRYQEENYLANTPVDTCWGRLLFWIRMAMLYSQYKIQLDNFLKSKPWGYRCEAGRKIAVLDYSGNFRLCELKDPEVNVKEINYDLGKFISSPKYQKTLERRVRKCDCTHVCFILESVYTNPKFVFSVLPFNLLRVVFGRYDF